jgi:hypothetical protein
MSLPAFLLEKLASPPVSGAGVHGWLFSCARQMHAHMAPDAIVAMLAVQITRCGRNVPDREIRDAVMNSKGVAWGVSGSPLGNPSQKPAVKNSGPVATSHPRWPLPNTNLRNAVGLLSRSDGISELYDLWELSPVRPPHSLDADHWLDFLFPGNPWLCVAEKHSADARSRPRDRWYFQSENCGLIVPSPMTGPSGMNKNGERSHRCLENTGPRRWLVVEFDSGTIDEQAQLHWALAQCSESCGWPKLALVVHSGGKSLHGWYGPVSDEDQAGDFFCHARTLGADPSTWTACQLIRMPDGRRGANTAEAIAEGNPPLITQPVFYFDPTPPCQKNFTNKPLSSRLSLQPQTSTPTLLQQKTPIAAPSSAALPATLPF